MVHLKMNGFFSKAGISDFPFLGRQFSGETSREKLWEG